MTEENRMGQKKSAAIAHPPPDSDPVETRLFLSSSLRSLPPQPRSAPRSTSSSGALPSRRFVPTHGGRVAQQEELNSGTTRAATLSVSTRLLRRLLPRGPARAGADRPCRVATGRPHLARSRMRWRLDPSPGAPLPPFHGGPAIWIKTLGSSVSCD